MNKYNIAMITKSAKEVKALYKMYIKKKWSMDSYALSASQGNITIYFFIPDTYLDLIQNVKFNEVRLISLDEGTVKDSIKTDAILRTIDNKGLIHIDGHLLQHIPFDYKDNGPRA